MNCAELLPEYDCRALRDDVFFVESPFSLGFDSEQLGAFVQAQPGGNTLISDDGQLLYAAHTHGIKLRPKLLKRLTDRISPLGITLGTEGDFSTLCPSSAVRTRLGDFFEGCMIAGQLLRDAYPEAVASFEDRLGDVLAQRFPRRVKRRFSVVGASGHQYQFPFALDAGTPDERLIHTVSGNTHSLRWSSVTQALGALVDVSRLSPKAALYVVMEGGPQDTIDQAKNALVEQANVIIYRDPESLDALGA